MTEPIQDYLAGHIRTIEVVSQELSASIARCSSLLVDALKRGKKLLIMGNGGSAADAQHMAAEFIGRFMKERRPLPALALNTDTSILTAVSNDFGFDEVFKKQVEALAVPGDVVLGISTSGKSNNVFYALTKANEIGCTTIGLLGRQGGNIGGIVDVNLTVPAQETPFIQEAHITIIHLLCDLVEKALFPAEEEKS